MVAPDITCPALPAPGDGDRFALLLSLASAEQYRGTPLYERLRQVYHRLLELLPPETRTNFVSLAAKVRFEGPHMPVVPEKIWNTLLGRGEQNAGTGASESPAPGTVK